MVDKKVIINGKSMMYGTSIKCSPELSTSTTTTFSGNIVQGLDVVPWSIEIGRVRYDSKTTHQELSTLIEAMYTTPYMVTIREIIKPSGEKPYEIVDNYHGCIVEGNDYEIKTDDHTVENLKFKATKRVRMYKDIK